MGARSIPALNALRGSIWLMDGTAWVQRADVRVSRRCHLPRGLAAACGHARHRLHSPLCAAPLSPTAEPVHEHADTHKNTQHAHTTPADTQARAHTRSTGSTSAHQHSHTSRLRARRLHTRGRVARFARRMCCMLHATSCMLHGVGPLASYAHGPVDAGRTGADGTVPVVAHRCGM